MWLALKVASQWKRWEGKERGTYNVFLIGSGLSLAMAYLGAWVAARHAPLAKWKSQTERDLRAYEPTRSAQDRRQAGLIDPHGGELDDCFLDQ